MYKNILIINLMHIGDLLFSTPFIHVVRNQYPNAHIAMLVDSKNSLVVKYNPNLSELIEIDKKGYHNKLPNYLHLISDIRQRKFDLVINLHGNERATVIAAFSGAKQIVGFAAKGLGFFLDSVVEECKKIHQVEAYLEILKLKSIGITEMSHQGLAMWVDDSSQQSANEMWRLSGKVIGFNTGGSWSTKRWTKKGFAELADRLLEEGYGIAFFGGPMDEQDVQEIRGLIKQSHHEKVAVFTGKTTLLEMAALVKKCAVVVTGDSGPMHIAVSQKVPVVGIFGPSDVKRYAPYGQEGNIVQIGCHCQPCGQHSCDIGHICMENLSVDIVLEKLKSLHMI